MKAFADEIKWGLWHGIYDTDGLCIVIPRVNVLSMSERLTVEGQDGEGEAERGAKDGWSEATAEATYCVPT